MFHVLPAYCGFCISVYRYVWSLLMSACRQPYCFHNIIFHATFSFSYNILFVELPYAAVLGVFHLESGSGKLVAYAVARGPVFLGLCLGP